MANLKIALDRSARSIDADGRLHIERSHISKATVNPYYGKEIPGYESLGLDPEKIYQLFRDPVELERAAPTFARLPILSQHVPVNVDEPRKDLIVGTIGSEVTFNKPYLDADLCIWDAAAIAGIETDQIRELSCAYRYVPVMESGEFEGRAYDGRMTEIVGNHLALVDVGRAGSDVLVADVNIFFKEEIMKMSKLSKALYKALSIASPVLAADAALPKLIGSIGSQKGSDAKKIDKKDLVTKLLALDGQLDEIKLGDLIDTLVDMEQEPAPAPAKDDMADPMANPDPQDMPNTYDDDSVEEKLRSMLSGKIDDELMNKVIEMCSAAKPATDEEKDKMDKPEPVMKKEDVDKAMDALRKELRAAEDARREVREVVGDVFSLETASEVYGFALDQMKVDCKDVTGEAALRALFKVAATKSAPRAPVMNVTQDSGELVKQFPAIARFL